MAPRPRTVLLSLTRAVSAPLAVALALVGCGGGGSPQHAPPSPPQWAPIATFSGSRDAARTVEVPRGALQWRTRWQCRSGQLTLTVTPPPRDGPFRSDEPCPSVGKAVWAGTGPQRLGVRASDSWRVVVEAYSAVRSAP